jgi:hypothetical protein
MPPIQVGGVLMRFTIRDVLWLTAAAALMVAWWVDNKRIESTVEALNKERMEQKAAFEDKLAVLDEAQKNRGPRFRKINELAPSAPIDLRDFQQ